MVYGHCKREMEIRNQVDILYLQFSKVLVLVSASSLSVLTLLFDVYILQDENNPKDYLSPKTGKTKATPPQKNFSVCTLLVISNSQHMSG